MDNAHPRSGISCLGGGGSGTHVRGGGGGGSASRNAPATAVVGGGGGRAVGCAGGGGGVSVLRNAPASAVAVRCLRRGACCMRPPASSYATSPSSLLSPELGNASREANGVASC